MSASVTLRDIRRDRLFLSTYARHPNWPRVSRRFRKKHPACAVCGAIARSNNSAVHHVLPFQWYPEKELDEDNLITLCRTHHWSFGHLCRWVSYNPDVVEDARIWNNKIKNRPKWKQLI